MSKSKNSTYLVKYFVRKMVKEGFKVNNPFSGKERTFHMLLLLYVEGWFDEDRFKEAVRLVYGPKKELTFEANTVNGVNDPNYSNEDIAKLLTAEIKGE